MRRRNDTTDRRIIWIRPTAKATSVHHKLMQMRRSVVAEVLDGLPAGAREQAYRSVQWLLRSVEDVLARKGKRSTNRRIDESTN